MNEGRIFLYVSPSILIPLMFGVMVLTALLVHFSILNNTTWFAGYWQGSAATAEAAAAPAPAMAAAPAMEEAAPMMEEAPVE